MVVVTNQSTSECWPTYH